MNPNRRPGPGGLELFPRTEEICVCEAWGREGEPGSAEGVLTAAIRSGERHIVV
jgi:hypothetical protein